MYVTGLATEVVNVVVEVVPESVITEVVVVGTNLVVTEVSVL